jgi:sugar/nucleoside kinase (ribokinase family)
MLTQLGTIEEMRWSDIDWDRVQECRHLHISSYYLQRNLRPDVGGIFRRAHELGLTTSLDTGWPSDEEQHDADLLEVWPHLDLFLPNESEAVQLSGRPSVEAALTSLGARIFTVVVKLGPNGSMARRRGQVVRSAGFQVEAVDTTGAGDSFNGGFLHGYLAGLHLEDCLDLGNACGALSTRGVGGTTTHAGLAEAQEFLRRTPRRT